MTAESDSGNMNLATTGMPVTRLPVTSLLIVATIAYEVSFQSSWQSYTEHIRVLVAEAAEQGADVLVFPEYFSMELASLYGEPVYQSLDQQLHAMQACLDDFIELFSQLAREMGVYILAGSFPVRLQETGPDVFVNRAYWCSPEADGQLQWQDKLIMTRFEREEWLISPGSELKVLDSRFGKVGVNICYDSEFPLLARRQVEQGANLLLVPSCTDTLAGFYRVQIGCRARALENQCFVVQSPTVGLARWSPAIDENIGAACVYGLVDQGFSPDGLVSEGGINQPGWVYAELDLSRIEAVRQGGQVTNFDDWVHQQAYL